MQRYNKSTQGFTLVEIMIVVVIIGLLASMAIPAFQKVRASSLEKAVLNDSRQIGAAAQQYFMEYGQTTVGFSYSKTDGKLTGALTSWVKQISRNYIVTSVKIDSTVTNAFDIQLAGAFGGTVSYFDAEGKRQ